MASGAGRPVGGQAPQQEDMQLAVFRVGGEEYAVDIMRIIEIIRPQKITRIPSAPQFMEGVINLRGMVVPIVDMRKRFGLGPAADDHKKARIVIVRVGGRPLGIQVDAVTEVLHMSKDQIEETPEPVKGIDAQYLEGVGKDGERLIVILDIQKLFTPDEAGQLRAAVEGDTLGRH